MNIFNELYYETHEDTLKEEYLDFLQEFGFKENEYPFFDFIDTYYLNILCKFVGSLPNHIDVRSEDSTLNVSTTAKRILGEFVD